MWIKCQLAMLPVEVQMPTNALDHIVKCIKSWNPIGDPVINEGYLSFCVNASEHVLNYYKAQRLYLLSNEKLKENEINDLLKTGLYFKSSNNLIELITYRKLKTPGVYKKIIATDDKNLDLQRFETDFINSFIKNSNNNYKIEEVDVRFEGTTELKLKVNQSSYTVFIRKFKIKWNREEVEELIKLAFKAGVDYESLSRRGFKSSAINCSSFIKNNL